MFGNRISALACIVTGASILFLASAQGAAALSPEVWFGPADSVAQGREEFPLLFDHPDQWSAVARPGVVFFTTITYLTRTRSETVKQQLTFLHHRGMKLAVSILGLPVDKHLCGDGVEGMVWPGEVRNAMRRLQELGAQPDYFSFDEPLSYGHFFNGRNACRFTVAETARRLAQSVKLMRGAFPKVRIVEAEVPTGKPLSEWTEVLAEWLSDYRAATGEDLYGLSMDPYWHHRWQEVIPATSFILRAHHIHVGEYLHADATVGESAAEWSDNVKRNICSIWRLHIAPDYVIMANWMVKSVKALPQSDPTSLAALTDWSAHFDWHDHAGCGAEDR
jgi:hypothetical protein